MGVPNKLIRKFLCRNKSAKSKPPKKNENTQSSAEDTVEIWHQRDQSFELDDDNIFEIKPTDHDSTTEEVIDAEDMKSQALAASDSDAETDIIIELKDIKMIYPVSDSDAEPEPEPEPEPDKDTIDIMKFQPDSDSDSDGEIIESKFMLKVEPDIVLDTPRSTSLRMLIRQSLREERAAVRIQTAFRAFLARRSLSGLKGLVKLQALSRGHGVRKQGAATFRSMLALVRVQAHVRARLARIAFEYEMDQWRKLQKQSGNTDSVKGGWCDSVGSFEEMQTKLMKRKEAAVKRERSWAYALARQWQARPRQQVQAHGSGAIQHRRDFEPSDRSSNWAWDWMEKWTNVRSWEKRFLDFDLKDGIKIVRKNNNASKMRKKKPTMSTFNHKNVMVPSRSMSIPNNKKPISLVNTRSSKPVNHPNDESRSRSNPKERLTSDKDGNKRLSLPSHGLDHRAQQVTKLVPRTMVKRIIHVAPKPVKEKAKVNKGHDVKPSRLSS